LIEKSGAGGVEVNADGPGLAVASAVVGFLEWAGDQNAAEGGWADAVEGQGERRTGGAYGNHAISEVAGRSADGGKRRDAPNAEVLMIGNQARHRPVTSWHDKVHARP